MSHPLLADLASAESGTRIEACRRAPADPSATLLVPALGNALGDVDRRVRRAASDALTGLGRGPGPIAAEVDATLRRVLRGTQRRGRWAAAWTTARLRPPEPGLLPAVVEALSDGDGDVRWAAARLLVDMARLHGEVAHAVLGLAQAADEPLARRMALFCLRELAPGEPSTAQALIRASREPDLELRRAALTAMTALLDPPPEALQRLLEALRSDADPACPRLAAVALGELAARDPALREPVLDALDETLEPSGDPSLRRATERARARARCDDEPAAPPPPDAGAA